MARPLNAAWVPDGRQPSGQLTWPLSPPVGCYHRHPLSPFITITQPERWCSFYHSTAGGRLSWPWHCRKGVQPVPKAVYHNGCHNKHSFCCPRWDLNLGPLTLQLPLNHCDLQRRMGVNNLPKVVTRQCGGWESNSQPSSCEPNTLTTRLLMSFLSPNQQCQSTKGTITKTLNWLAKGNKFVEINITSRTDIAFFVPEMTYNVFSGTLNPTHFTSLFVVDYLT